LALVTGALPVAMSFGIVVYFRRRAGGALGRCDAIACFAVLQWSVVLMVGHMLPFRLWT
jgi:hypothetical protein